MSFIKGQKLGINIFQMMYLQIQSKFFNYIDYDDEEQVTDLH